GGASRLRCTAHSHSLPSFPTRRSSDLVLIRLAEIVGLGVERPVECHNLGGRHPHPGRGHALASLDLPEVDVRVVAEALTELTLDPRRDVQALVVIRGRHHALEPDLDAALA